MAFDLRTDLFAHGQLCVIYDTKQQRRFVLIHGLQRKEDCASTVYDEVLLNHADCPTEGNSLYTE